MTFADIGDSFLHQVNDATRGSNNDMHCGKERWRGGGGGGLTKWLNFVTVW